MKAVERAGGRIGLPVIALAKTGGAGKQEGWEGFFRYMLIRGRGVEGSKSRCQSRSQSDSASWGYCSLVYICWEFAFGGGALAGGDEGIADGEKGGCGGKW